MSMINFCVGQDLAVSGAVTTDAAFISFIALHANGSDAGTILVKDGDDSGDVIFKATVNSTESSKFFQFSIPLRAANAIYVELTTATATIGYFG